MSYLPLFVEREDLPVSADCWLEVDVLLEQVHLENADDTYRFFKMFVSSLGDEKVRYAEAIHRHDLAAADESAAEMRDLTALAATCQAHLRNVGYVRQR